MRYSEFGKVRFFCPACHQSIEGRLGEGVGPHFRSIHCEHCGKHTSQWLSFRSQNEQQNPAVENAVLLVKRQPKQEIQYDLFGNEGDR